MPLLVAALKMLFASSLFNYGFFSAGNRLKHQKATKLAQVQATRSTPPLGPAGSRSGGGTTHNSYGLAGVQKAMAAWDKKAAAAKAEAEQDKSNLYGGLFKSSGTTAAATRASSAAPDADELVQAHRQMDKNKDGKIDLRELHQGMKDLGSPMEMTELREFVGSADDNGDGKLNAQEFVSAIYKKANLAKMESTAIDGEAFAEEAVKSIDSLIVFERGQYAMVSPSYSGFLQKIKKDGIQGRPAGQVLMGIYTQCGTSEVWREGFHEHCVLSKLEPLICEEGKLALPDYPETTFLTIFVKSVFAHLEGQIGKFFEMSLRTSPRTQLIK